MELQRREFLQGMLIAGGVSCAGCINSDSDDDFEPYLNNIILLNYHSSEHSITVEMYKSNNDSDVLTDEKLLDTDIKLPPATPHSERQISPTSATITDFSGDFERYKLEITMDNQQTHPYTVKNIEDCIEVEVKINQIDGLKFDWNNKTICYD